MTTAQPSNPHVIIAAQGAFAGLNACLASIQKNSPNTPIHVIGDDATAALTPCEPWCGYSTWANQFEKFYTHHHDYNAAGFELKCLQRWFTIYEYALYHEIYRFWAFDWDVLVFTDLEKEPMPLAMSKPKGVFYCREIKALGLWLDEIRSAYRDKNVLYQRWRRLYLDAKWVGISDMHIADDTAAPLGHLFEHNPWGYWDENLTSVGSCEGENVDGARELRSKRLIWSKGIPVIQHHQFGYTPLKGLHCWGSHKSRMEEYLRESEASK